MGLSFRPIQALDFHGFGGHFRVFFRCFFRFFFYSSVEAKNVVWTHYLLCIRHMAVVEKNRKLSKKRVKKWDCLLDYFQAPFWRHFGSVLGSLLGALGRHLGKKGGPGRDRKIDEKNGTATHLLKSGNLAAPSL